MVTVSIVCYHTEVDELSRSLDSLQSAAVGRIYVVDNSSQAYLRDYCRERGVEYISSANVGYGAGHNQAIRRALAAGSRYHLVMNSDVEFTPAVVGRIEAFMEANTDVGLLQPRVLNVDGSVQSTCRLLPTPFDLVLRRFLPESLFRGRRRRYTLEEYDHRTPLEVAYLQGSFLFFRLADLEKVGLFDERFFMYPEDIDISRRMRRISRVLYWPEVEIVHAHRASSYRSAKMLRIHVENMIRYFNKWGWLVDAERRRLNREVLHKALEASGK